MPPTPNKVLDSIPIPSSPLPDAAPSSVTNERTLHLVMQGKGGVGKSLISLLLAQFLQELGRPLELVDTDPVNPTFSNLSPIPVKLVDVFRADDTTDVRALDMLVERMATEAADFVVDNGAASFVPFSRYLIENGALDVLLSTGCRVVIHTVVTGGGGMEDTIVGLESILAGYPPEVRLVVWLNEKFGPIVSPRGSGFEELPIYKDHKSRIHALVHLPALSEHESADLLDMLRKKMTFSQATAAEPNGIFMMQKSRLFRMRGKVWPRIAEALS